MSGGGTSIVEVSETGVRSAVARYFAAVNADRYDDVAALFAPDGVISAPGVEDRRGHGQIAAYLDAVLRGYPTHTDKPVRVLVAGTTATVEIRFTGTVTGGGAVEFDAVDIFDFDPQGAISRLTTWYDSAAVGRRLRALAAQPAMTSTSTSTPEGSS